MGNYLGTKLDSDQVIRRAYDESSNRLRVDAAVTASIGDVIISAATSDIRISDGTDTLAINPDGSINVNVFIDHTNDSIRLGDGTNLITSTTAGPKHALDTVGLNSLIPVAFDTILPSYPTSTKEIYVYKSSGTTVATVTVDYVDASKNDLVSIVRT